jgi:hypothetical protein
MPHGIDAAMNAVEVPGTAASGPALTADPASLELFHRDNAMLAGGQASDRCNRIPSGAFFTHVRE